MNAARLAPLLLLGLAAACARMPLDQAEAQCASIARSGAVSNSAITVGVGGGFGSSGGAGIALTTDIPQYRDPETTYRDCVRRKSGQFPLTPYAFRPESKG